MNKSTIVLLLCAALGLGTLIGVGFVDTSNTGDYPVSATTMSTNSNVSLESNGGAPVFRFFDPADIKVSLDVYGKPLALITGENFIGRYDDLKSETLNIEIPGDAAIEYKAIMNEGDSIVFDWTANGGAVYSDFHGHDQANADFFVRYEASEHSVAAGMIVAAFAGGHGWYWLNLDDDPVTITLRVSGFFKEIKKMDVDY